MNNIIKLISSEKYYLFLGYLFLFIGVFFVLKEMPQYYEMLLIISLVQFLLYAIKKYIKMLSKNKSNLE